MKHLEEKNTPNILNDFYYRWRKKSMLPVTCPCRWWCFSSYLPTEGLDSGPGSETSLTEGELTCCHDLRAGVETISSCCGQ